MMPGDESSRAELRNFGLVLGCGAALFFGLLGPLLFDRNIRAWPFVAGVLFCLWGLLIPTTLRPLHFLWMRIGHVLGWINTRIILGLVFFLIVTPAGLVLRLLGKDPMHRDFDPAAPTYRVPSASEDFKRMEAPY